MYGKLKNTLTLLGLFGVPVLIILVGCLAFSYSDVFGPIKPDQMSRATLIRIMHWRDFRDFSPELLRQITDRADSEFGRKGPHRPVFAFGWIEKKLYAHFLVNNTKPPAQLKINLRLMTRTRYVQWMNDYQFATALQQKAQLDEVVDEMKYWERVYMDFYCAAGVPVPNFEELIRQFDEMIEQFKIGAVEEEIVRIDDFKRTIRRTIIAHHIKGAVENLSNNVSSTVSIVVGSFLTPPKKKEKNEKSEE